MKKTSVIVDATGSSGFFKRARAHADALDRGELIPSRTVIAFENPADFTRLLTGERIRLLRSLSEAGDSPITELALRLQRNKRAVVRDVNALKAHGLVETRHVSNAGHGRNLLVMRAARRMELRAAL